MSASRTASRVSRAPNGCNAPPVYVSFKPDERGEIKQVADADSRSMSAMTRHLTLLGLREWRRGRRSLGDHE